MKEKKVSSKGVCSILVDGQSEAYLSRLIRNGLQKLNSKTVSDSWGTLALLQIGTCRLAFAGIKLVFDLHQLKIVLCTVLPDTGKSWGIRLKCVQSKVELFYSTQITHILIF